jgi:uncharacterized Fe-S cluster-containing radical SAM superfamily protein
MKEKEYPGCLRSGFEPFDPLTLASWTKDIVCKDSMRKYTDFYYTGVYGGISTGYTVGCCLRCVFCWVDFSRDFLSLRPMASFLVLMKDMSRN